MPEADSPLANEEKALKQYDACALMLLCDKLLFFTKKRGQIYFDKINLSPFPSTLWGVVESGDNGHSSLLNTNTSIRKRREAANHYSTSCL
jgi:hypothetical protein